MKNNKNNKNKARNTNKNEEKGLKSYFQKDRNRIKTNTLMDQEKKEKKNEKFRRMKRIRKIKQKKKIIKEKDLNGLE